MRDISDAGLTIALPDGWRCVHDGDPYSIVRLDRAAYITFGTAFGMGNSSPEDLLQFVLMWGRANDLGGTIRHRDGRGPAGVGRGKLSQGRRCRPQMANLRRQKPLFQGVDQSRRIG